MGAVGTVATVVGILGTLVGVGYLLIMTLHMLLVGTAAAKGSDGDERSAVSRLFGNTFAIAVGAVIITTFLGSVGVFRAGGFRAMKSRREPQPYMNAVNFEPDAKYETFGTAPKTPLAMILAKIDSIVFVLFGIRIVQTNWNYLSRSGATAEATPHLRKVFGPQDDFREGVSALAEDWQGGAPFARTTGLLGLQRFLREAIAARESVIQYHAEHPEVGEIPVKRPLLLIGLPRTGTTLLHRLLSLDPMSRTLRNWECCKPVRCEPPVFLSLWLAWQR